MSVTSGSTTITKDNSNLIGISIGGGVPFCPVVYVVQVFDNTPASKDGILEAGDEIVAVNGTNVRGKTKVEVAKMIQSTPSEVVINYNKLHADVKEGKTLDIVLKKMKHRLVDNMSSETADALGLSRAILCNDSLIKRLADLEGIEFMYEGLCEHIRQTAKALVDLCHIYKEFGDVFASIGVREPQPEASLAFTKFGDTHRLIEKKGIEMLRSIKLIMLDLKTFLSKAIPDTRLTIKKYADTKFEYLSYCLKIKEMDDEEYAYQALDEPLYRVETGNFEYRLILRCRQEAKARFASLRSDVLVKLELLDQKHVQDVISQLQKLLSALSTYHAESYQILKEGNFFPLEVDLSSNCTFNYPDPTTSPYQDEDEEEGETIPDEVGIEVTEEGILNLTLTPALTTAEHLSSLVSGAEVGNTSNTSSKEGKETSSPKAIDDLLSLE